MGTLERLQNAVFDILKSLGDLKFATIVKQSDFPDTESAADAEGVCIRVLRPLPTAASKYAAGPTFANVELRVETERAKYTAENAPSLLTVCEIVSRALHGHNAPLECGYGRISLCENTPWNEGKTSSQSDKITVRFNVQSVLQ